LASNASAANQGRWQIPSGVESVLVLRLLGDGLVGWMTRIEVLELGRGGMPYLLIAKRPRQLSQQQRAFGGRQGDVVDDNPSIPTPDHVHRTIVSTSAGKADEARPVVGDDWAGQRDRPTDHGAGRLVLLDKDPPRVLTLDPLTGVQDTIATFPSGATPNYAAWGPDNALYVTDYTEPIIWRIPPGGGTPQQWFTDPQLNGGMFGTTAILLEAAATTPPPPAAPPASPTARATRAGAVSGCAPSSSAPAPWVSRTPEVATVRHDRRSLSKLSPINWCRWLAPMFSRSPNRWMK